MIPYLKDTHMKLFSKKKQAAEPARPVDKKKAVPGFTKAIMQFAQAQKKMEPEFLPIYLYVTDKKTGDSPCFLSTTYFARINNHPKHPEHGFSLFLNQTMLGELYDSFVHSDAAKVFTKENGIIDSPACPHEKCEYYIKDFGYDAEEASAVIAMLLEEVFDLKPEDMAFHLQLFGWNEENDGQESTAELDRNGNVIAKSGFSHDLF